ncbi:MAG TPA: hypothetical protein VFY24_07460 [Azospira sp.]|nr:hypothetical protein [Azospira sp.]
MIRSGARAGLRRRTAVAGLVLLASAGLAAAETPPLDRTPVEATTAQGEAVRLYPNGRWEFVDAARAAQARELAARYPENHTRPLDAQGGAFGIGRTVMPGDKDYNRGSLSGKGR